MELTFGKDEKKMNDRRQKLMKVVYLLMKNLSLLFRLSSQQVPSAIFTLYFVYFQ